MQVYGRLLTDGVMLVFFNPAPVTDDAATTFATPDTPRELCCDAACWSELQMQAGGQLKQGDKFKVRDVWAHIDNGTAVVGEELCVAWPAAEGSIALRLAAVAAE